MAGIVMLVTSTVAQMQLLALVPNAEGTDVPGVKKPIEFIEGIEDHQIAPSQTTINLPPTLGKIEVVQIKWTPHQRMTGLSKSSQQWGSKGQSPNPCKLLTLPNLRLKDL